MAARITVYCRKSLAQVTTSDLLLGIELSDLETIAEGFGVPDEAIEAALANLRIESRSSDGEFRVFILYYGPDATHQCRIERWIDRGDVDAVVTEHFERIADSRHSALSTVRKHLQDVKECVFVQFGSNPGMEMAPTLASEVARWLAEQGDGLIGGADGTWWQLGEWQEYKRLIP